MTCLRFLSIFTLIFASMLIDCGRRCLDPASCLPSYSAGIPPSPRPLPDPNLLPLLITPQPKALPNQQALCIQNNWCWEAPLPQGADLSAAWVDSQDTVWVIGDHGTILRFDENVWVQFPIPEAARYEDLKSIWGSSPNDIWIVGTHGLILRWNGSSWKIVPSGTRFSLSFVQGNDPSHIVAFGEQNTVLLWDGTIWSVQPVPPGSLVELDSVSMSPEGTIWFLGVGLVTDEQGKQRTQTFLTSSTGKKFTIPLHDNFEFNIFALADDDVWVTLPTQSSGPHVWRCDGKTLSEVAVPFPLSWHGHFVSGYIDLTKVEQGSLWMLGLYGQIFIQQTDTGWTPWMLKPGTGAINKIVAAKKNLWLVGDKGLVLQFDGSTWFDHRLKSPDFLPFQRQLSKEGMMWGLSTKGIVKQQGTGWVLASSVPGGVRWKTFSSASDSSVWAVGYDETAGQTVVLENTRGTWTTHVLPNFKAISVTVVDPNDVWVGGDNRQLRHFDGHTWINTTLPRSPTFDDGDVLSLWASGPDDIWAVMYLQVFHYDGKIWTEDQTLPSEPFYYEPHLWSVWGSGSNDVWIVGLEKIFHWNGAAWSLLPVPGIKADERSPGLLQVVGISSSDVWAMGRLWKHDIETLAMWHWDGTAWERIDVYAGPFQPTSSNWFYPYADPPRLSVTERDVWIANDDRTKILVHHR